MSKQVKITSDQIAPMSRQVAVLSGQPLIAQVYRNTEHTKPPFGYYYLDLCVEVPTDEGTFRVHIRERNWFLIDVHKVAYGKPEWCDAKSCLKPLFGTTMRANGMKRCRSFVGSLFMSVNKIVGRAYGDHTHLHCVELPELELLLKVGATQLWKEQRVTGVWDLYVRYKEVTFICSTENPPGSAYPSNWVREVRRR